MITQCCMRHLYTTKDQNLIEGARRFERRRCGHHELEQPLPALECLESCVDPKGTGTNSHRYIVAVQEPEIRAKMREIPGVPLIYINRSIVILEPMAGVTRDVMERGERAKLRMGVRGKLTVGKRKLDGEGGTLPSEETSGQVGRDRKEYLVQKKRKRSKGPNPLSVKKPKKRAL